MNRRVEILTELNELSPLIGGIGNSNIFTVPDGYFATVSETVLICCKEENNLVNIDKSPNDVVPDNYFDTLAGNIMAKIKGYEELSAPDELKEISPLLAGIDKINPFIVPQGYFEQLLSSLAQTDKETVPALFRDRKSSQPFQIPEGYFENLPAAVLSKVKQKAAVKVVQMYGRNILKYAAAAVITGALALGVIKYINTPVIDSTGIVAAVKLDPSIEKGKNMDDKKFDETLNNLSEEDIAQYLVKNGSDADIASLTSGMEDNDLPSQEDYLSDNSALDNFLKEIDSKNIEN